MLVKSGAVIIGDYRYLLWREWDSQNPTVAFIMLNPSRADAEFNDPTITRCINFAQAWGYGRLEVVNLFAYRTAHPSLLKQAAKPVGSNNDQYVLTTVQHSEQVILAWGNHGTWQQQDLHILELLKNYTYPSWCEFPSAGLSHLRGIISSNGENPRGVAPLYCFGMTKKGCPRHPLYLHHKTQLQIFS